MGGEVQQHLANEKQDSMTLIACLHEPRGLKGSAVHLCSAVWVQLQTTLRGLHRRFVSQPSKQPAAQGCAVA